jgi:pimeloyl-ACP methyl ester carboxylesterase
MIQKTRAMALAATTLLLTGCTTIPTSPLDQTPPIIFVHGNGDTAALWQTTLWRFESNGWPRDRLHAIEVPYPLARDDNSKPQPGRTSTAEHMAYLKAEIENVLKTTGASKVILIGNSRGGNAIRNYIQTESKHGNDAIKVSHAILGGTPNHGIWAIKGFREGNEFSGTGPFLTVLNASKNAAGDEVTGPAKWMTIRSDNNDKYARPDGVWIGQKGRPTNITYAGPELKGATNVVIPRIDHRETSFSAPAFEATWRFITGKVPKTLDIQPESQIDLSGRVTGLGVKPDDPKSGNFANNLPLTGARLEIYATDATQGEKAGTRLGDAVYSKTIGEDGKWGPFRAQAGVPYEFVISAPGYATTHIYRSPVPRSSDIVNLRAERIADADKDAKAIIIMARPRGYFDVGRDRMSFDGKMPPGLPATGAGISTSKIVMKDDTNRAIATEFNGERVTGRTWGAGHGHVVYLEVTH